MTKSNSSRKQISGKTHSKLSRMRKKLTLNQRPSPVLNKINSKREEKKDRYMDAGEKQTDKVIKDEVSDPAKDETLNDENKEEGQVKTKTFFQRASPMKLVRIYPSLNEDQQILIRNEDYGGLLDIRCSKLQPDLCQFLMESFDATSCKMVFPGRGEIPVTEKSVQEVIGVPFGTIELKYGLDPEAVSYMEKKLGKVGKKTATHCIHRTEAGLNEKG